MKVLVHGAFEPATGQAAILMSPGRDSASHIQLLEQVILQFPSDRWLLIEDNLTMHTSKQVNLALAETLVQAGYAFDLSQLDEHLPRVQTGIRAGTDDETGSCYCMI